MPRQCLLGFKIRFSRLTPCILTWWILLLLSGWELITYRFRWIRWTQFALMVCECEGSDWGGVFDGLKSAACSEHCLHQSVHVHAIRKSCFILLFRLKFHLTKTDILVFNLKPDKHTWTWCWRWKLCMLITPTWALLLQKSNSRNVKYNRSCVVICISRWTRGIALVSSINEAERVHEKYRALKLAIFFMVRHTVS